MIRYLLLILFIVLVIFATRALRRPGQGGSRPSGQQPGRSDDNDEAMMLACAHCGLHLPRNEVLPGKAGVYCSEAHRAAAEARDGSA
ncbi:MAG: PP0621 family protein [Ideonella sp.]